MAEEAQNIDMRFYSDEVDVTELPSAYKNAKEIISQIEKFRLAKVMDTIEPFGCIMGGVFDWKALREKNKYSKRKESPKKFSEVRDQLILPGVLL